MNISGQWKISHRFPRQVYFLGSSLFSGVFISWKGFQTSNDWLCHNYGRVIISVASSHFTVRFSRVEYVRNIAISSCIRVNLAWGKRNCKSNSSCSRTSFLLHLLKLMEAVEIKFSLCIKAVNIVCLTSVYLAWGGWQVVTHFVPTTNKYLLELLRRVHSLTHHKTTFKHRYS